MELYLNIIIFFNSHFKILKLFNNCLRYFRIIIMKIIV